ncbi:uncharacterized protein BDW47DRAFT_99101, partial [Aspergillus candidus]
MYVLVFLPPFWLVQMTMLDGWPSYYELLLLVLFFSLFFPFCLGPLILRRESVLVVGIYRCSNPMHI